MHSAEVGAVALQLRRVGDQLVVGFASAVAGSERHLFRQVAAAGELADARAVQGHRIRARARRVRVRRALLQKEDRLGHLRRPRVQVDDGGIGQEHLPPLDAQHAAFQLQGPPRAIEDARPRPEQAVSAARDDVAFQADDRRVPDVDDVVGLDLDLGARRTREQRRLRGRREPQA